MSAPNLSDLQAPFDPTAYVSVSGAMLLQLISGAFPQTDKGMVLMTEDDNAGNPTVPNATVITKWQNYFWLRKSATSVGVYVWNPSAAVDATYLQWQSINIAGIAAGSLQTFMYADNSITSPKIISLDYSKITGAPAGLPPSGAAGGDLTGTFPNPSIGALKVVNGSIADATVVGSAKLVDASVSLAKQAPVSGSAKDMARVNGAATGMEAFTPPVIFTSGVVVPAANALKLPQVNAGATDFQMVLPTTLGNVLQVLSKAIAGGDSTATAIPIDNTIPQIGEGKEYVTLAITPISATSLLRIQFSCFVGNNGANNTSLALFQDAGADALRAVTVKLGGAGYTEMASIDFWIVSGSLVARTYRIRFGPDSGTGYINQLSGGAVFGGVSISNLSITEFVGTLS